MKRLFLFYLVMFLVFTAALTLLSAEMDVKTAAVLVGSVFLPMYLTRKTLDLLSGPEGYNFDVEIKNPFFMFMKIALVLVYWMLFYRLIVVDMLHLI